MTFKGKVALVTGAARGIGKAIAEAFAREGAHVVLNDIWPQEDLARVANDISTSESQCAGIRADVSDSTQVRDMMAQIVERFGRIDILVNNAGIFIPADPETIIEEEWDGVLNTNLKGAFLCAQAVGRVMIAQGGGKIINVSSVSGSRATPIPPSASYDASKGGLENLTRALAIAWAQYHINVNAIAPCALETPMRVPLAEAEESRKTAWIPMGRRGVPEDLIGAMVFLSSPASDFMTGHVLAVDGGRLAW
ncbi:MAG: SDR family oxidoreductase [Deltaproteobacteria bacterium]|nr:SDR family oxidoreductase [Deltaproteobacteria bacterium]